MMISRTRYSDPIATILHHTRLALIGGLTTTGYAHLEIRCSIIHGKKGIVRIHLNAGTKYSSTVSPDEIKAHLRERERMQQPTIISRTHPDPLKEILEHIRIALINGITETGHVHLDVNCELINPEKGIVRVELTTGTKYSFIVSRREVSAVVR